MDQEIARNEPCTAACVRRNAFPAVAVGAAAQKRAPLVRPALQRRPPALDQRGDQSSRTIDNVIALFPSSRGHGYTKMVWLQMV